MRKKSITMTDVARRAEVSISTVSRVVSGAVNVSDPLRKRVDAALAELQYQPIRAGLRFSAVDNIAVLIPDISSPFFHRVIRGIQSFCSDKGYTLQIYSAGHDPEKEMIYAGELAERADIRGVIITGAWNWEHQEPVQKLSAALKPICLINRFAPAVKADLLQVEREQGTRNAAVHLLQLGHTRIGCITGKPNASAKPDQVAGYRRALEDYQIDIEEDLIVETRLSARGGYRAGLELLTRKRRPSAILARSDRLAIGAMRAAWELSITIPEELSVIGFGDEPDAKYMRPALTTVRQPQYEMGTRAANLLFERIANPALPQRQVILQPQLIARETTMAPCRARQMPKEMAAVQ